MAKRRTHCALGVVFVHERCSEDGDDRIADELLDGASMTLELRPDAGVIRRQLRAHVLGIELLCARRRADEVAEDDRDDLAFLDRPGSRGEARSALGAELRLRRVLEPQDGHVITGEAYVAMARVPNALMSARPSSGTPRASPGFYSLES